MSSNSHIECVIDPIFGIDNKEDENNNTFLRFIECHALYMFSFNYYSLVDGWYYPNFTWTLSPKGGYRTCLVDGDQIHMGMSLNTLLVAFTFFHRNM